MQFGRCSVRTFYPPALEVLRNHLDIFSSFVEHKVPLDKAEEVSTPRRLRRSRPGYITDFRSVLHAVRKESHLKDGVCYEPVNVFIGKAGQVQ